MTMTITEGTTTGELPTSLEGLTPAWLTAALSERHPGTVVEDLRVESVIWGTATKVFLDVQYRHRPAGGPPRALCVKGGFQALATPERFQVRPCQVASSSRPSATRSAWNASTGEPKEAGCSRRSSVITNPWFCSGLAPAYHVRGSPLSRAGAMSR